MNERFTTIEQTLSEVLQAMQLGFARAEERTERGFIEVQEQFSEIHIELGEIHIELGEMHIELAEIKDEMHVMNRRVGKGEIRNEDSADTLLNHEERITHLEKSRRLPGS